MQVSLESANEYHSNRLTSEAWFAETETRRTQALQSAEDLLHRILKRVLSFSDAVICEQAAYMMTSDFEARANKHASEHLEGLSVSYHWDDARGLLAPLVEDEFEDELSGGGACKFGRIR
jgi:hypothetical protein